MAWIDAQAIETLYLSTITVAELRFGIKALPSGRRKTELDRRLEADVLPLFDGRIVPFDMDATQAFANLMAKAGRDGRAISKADGYIAAIAVSRGFPVATRDVSPFLAAGLSVIDPWTSA